MKRELGLRNDPDIADILAGRPIKRLQTPEMQELARRALEAVKAREGEDIEAWAARLAADVANAND